MCPGICRAILSDRFRYSDVDKVPGYVPGYPLTDVYVQTVNAVHIHHQAAPLMCFLVYAKGHKLQLHCPVHCHCQDFFNGKSQPGWGLSQFLLLNGLPGQRLSVQCHSQPGYPDAQCMH